MSIFDKHPRPWRVARFASGAYLFDANSNILDESEDVYAPLVSAVNAEPGLREASWRQRSRTASERQHGITVRGR